MTTTTTTIDRLLDRPAVTHTHTCPRCGYSETCVTARHTPTKEAI